MLFAHDHGRAWKFFTPQLVLCLVLLGLVAGCSTTQTNGTRSSSHRFDFSRDTFAYANQLVWEYEYDANGRWTGHRREPKPDYTLHCFVMARSAAQFFAHALFDPALPVADQETYHRLIHKVVSRGIRKASARSEKIVIPGYSSLREFSRAQEPLLKSECGSFLQSYFQRGNWRMVLPFTRGHQKNTANHLLQELAAGRPPVVHVVRFPQLTINHAVVFYGAEPAGPDTLFLAYDPNDPLQPLRITYSAAERTFALSPTDYFPGGRVDVYQVYHRWNY